MHAEGPAVQKGDVSGCHPTLDNRLSGASRQFWQVGTGLGKGGLWAELAGGPGLVEEKQDKGGSLVLGVEAEDCGQAARQVIEARLRRGREERDRLIKDVEEWLEERE
jgi:hypothetical protein